MSTGVPYLDAILRSYGTEDRPTDRPVAPRDETYECIFRGAGIKDIICQPSKSQPTLESGLGSSAPGGGQPFSAAPGTAVNNQHQRGFLGRRVRVELAMGDRQKKIERDRRPRGWEGGYGNYGRRSPQRGNFAARWSGPPVRTSRTQWRVIVDNISSRTSWQELKDYFRSAGDVHYCTANQIAYGIGMVEFIDRRGMENAIDRFNNSELDGKIIRVHEEGKESRGRSRSRSRSPINRKSRSPKHRRSDDHRRSRTPDHQRTRSPINRRLRLPNNRRSGSPNNRRSRSPNNRRSRSPSGRRSRGKRTISLSVQSFFSNAAVSISQDELKKRNEMSKKALTPAKYEEEKEKQTKSKIIGTSKTSKKGEGKSSVLESIFRKLFGIAFQNIEEIGNILRCSTSKDLLDNTCSKFLARPIYQCRNGHLLCESCQKRSTKMCKTCENSNENSCNESLENFFLRNLMAEYAVDYVSTAKTRFTQISTTSFNWKEKKSRIEKMMLMDIQSLERTLECPVCLELPKAPIDIHHCRNGHHICHSCSSKVDTCPICQIHLDLTEHWRNLALERLIDFVHTASERYNRVVSNSAVHENKRKQEKRLLDKNVYGVVKWFNEEKGYGFIQRYDTKEEIIVFRDGIFKDSTVSSKTIKKADGVNFDIEIVQKGVKAVNVVVKCAGREKEKDEILEVEVFGVVNWYDIEKGYGLIRRSNTEEKIIVLKSGISKNRFGGTKSLQSDEAVMFNIVINKKGIKAVNVTSVDEDDSLKEN